MALCIDQKAFRILTISYSVTAWSFYILKGTFLNNQSNKKQKQKKLFYRYGNLTCSFVSLTAFII